MVSVFTNSQVPKIRDTKSIGVFFFLLILCRDASMFSQFLVKFFFFLLCRDGYSAKLDFSNFHSVPNSIRQNFVFLNFHFFSTKSFGETMKVLNSNFFFPGPNSPIGTKFLFFRLKINIIC